MKGEIITVTTKDQIILHGIVCIPPNHQVNSTCVIHVHGSYGNFYENFFLAPMAHAFNAQGISFIAINTRGRDYLADFKTLETDKYSSRRIGGIREVFKNCEHDIRAWVEYARSIGCSKIVLQGHSLGAMKVAFYTAHWPTDINGVTLLSPPDNIGLQKNDAGTRYDEFLATAKELARSDPNSLMPAEAYYDPISAAAYESLFGSPENTGMFTFGDEGLMRTSALSRIACPLLVTFATQNEAVANDLETCKTAILRSVRNPERVRIEVVHGANHSYHFCEQPLAELLADWTCHIV
jgi:alpha-beta hydrolase superfamily lysophospholipase